MESRGIRRKQRSSTILCPTVRRRRDGRTARASPTRRCSPEERTVPDITFVITSAARFDLLVTTLDSFFQYNTAPISRYVLVEDRGGRSVLDILEKYPVKFDVMINDPPVGAIASVDRAYRTVTTPYIFHCEDDWRFFRSGFVEESMALLEAFPDISVVVSRRRGQTPMSDLIYQGALRKHQDIAFRRAPTLAHPHWLGYSFNPGLRRLSDYRKIGSFGRWGVEIDASIYFKRMGMTMAVLEEPACETTGWKRHVKDPTWARNWRGRLQQKQRTLAHYAQAVLHGLGIRKERRRKTGAGGGSSRRHGRPIHRYRWRAMRNRMRSARPRSSDSPKSGRLRSTRRKVIRFMPSSAQSVSATALATRGD